MIRDKLVDIGNILKNKLTFVQDFYVADRLIDSEGLFKVFCLENNKQKFLLNFSDNKGMYFYIRIHNPINYNELQNVSSCYSEYETDIAARIVFFLANKKLDVFALEHVISYEISKINTILLINSNLNKYEVFNSETNVEMIPNLDNVVLLAFDINFLYIREYSDCDNLLQNICSSCNVIIPN